MTPLAYTFFNGELVRVIEIRDYLGDQTSKIEEAVEVTVLDDFDRPAKLTTEPAHLGRFH